MTNYTELKNILRNHIKQYPKLHAVDLIRLMWQNEYFSIPLSAIDIDKWQLLWNKAPDQKKEPTNPFELIGNGLARLHINNLVGTEIERSTVNKFICYTVQTAEGTQKNLINKLKILREFLIENQQENLFQEYEQTVEEWIDNEISYPDHSPIYQKAYQPDYFIVLEVFRRLFNVFRKIDSLLAGRPYVNVAIDGPCGSGKTTLAYLLQQIYDANRIPMDHFFLPAVLRTSERLSEPGGNIHYERFLSQVAPALRKNEPFDYHVFNCKVMDFDRTICVYPKRLNIIEGTYSLNNKFDDLYQLKIFLQVSELEQMKRLICRNGIDEIDHFTRKWIPLENNYFSKCNPAGRSDLIVECWVDKRQIPLEF